MVAAAMAVPGRRRSEAPFDQLDTPSSQLSQGELPRDRRKEPKRDFTGSEDSDRLSARPTDLSRRRGPLQVGSTRRRVKQSGFQFPAGSRDLAASARLLSPVSRMSLV
jgi:hypothetical protein